MGYSGSDHICSSGSRLEQANRHEANPHEKPLPALQMSCSLLLLETESENEFRPLDERIDEFHPKATRTLFIGNLEKTTTYHDLRNIFQRFGGIVVCEASVLCSSLPALPMHTCKVLQRVVNLSISNREISFYMVI